jgi:5-methylcytosine-specific restriction endonuclease McrA
MQANAAGGPVTEQLSVRTVAAPFPKARPLAPQRFALQLTMDQSTHDKLRYAQSLLGHRVASGDLAQVLDRALDALIAELEKQAFAATDRPQRAARPARSPRTIPARIKRAVWERDGGRCTFVSESGHRCQAHTLLQYDHVDPVARGGEATVANTRLHCRTHNQMEAEQAFGAGFMQDKRAAARREREHKRAAAADPDVVAALRALKFSADEARRAAALCEAIPDASLEARVKRALSYFGSRCIRPPAA